VTTGEKINLGAAELGSPLFFVLWNDLRVLRGGTAGRMTERLALTPEELARRPDHPTAFKRLCTVPVIQDSRFETMATLTAPLSVRGSVSVVPYPPGRDGLPSLYPFEGIGVYDRERFLSLGGYDRAIRSFYWQLMDFGTRARLWGEEITATQSIKLSYQGTVIPEDGTRDANYRRFYLKNQAPVFRGDYAHIPLRRFPAYWKNSGTDLLEAWGEFAEIRRWVRDNRFRFRGDLRTISGFWEPFEAAVSTDPADAAVLEAR